MAICAIVIQSPLRWTRSTSFFTRPLTAVTCPRSQNFVHVNSLGTAQMLESDPRENLPVKKVVVASSQAVYSEGAGDCPNMDWFFRRCGRWNNCAKAIGRCIARLCGATTTSVPTPENAPVGGETVYGLTKVDQERLVLLWGKQSRYPDGRAALLLHIRAAPIDL
mgnify:CR=1 FL=1